MRHEYVQSREGITSMKMLLTWMEKGQCVTPTMSVIKYIYKFLTCYHYLRTQQQ